MTTPLAAGAQHPSSSEANCRLTLQKWWHDNGEAVAPSLATHYGGYDEPKVFSRLGEWARFDWVSFGGWPAWEKPSLFRMVAFTRHQADPYAIRVMELCDRFRNVFDAEHGVPLLDFSSDPHSPPYVSASNADIYTTSADSAMRLYVRALETTTLAGTFANQSDTVHARAVLFDVWHWRMARTW